MSKIELIHASCADQTVDAVVNAANDGLASFNLREGDVKMPILSLGIYDTLQGTKIACLCPWVKVVNDCFAIDSHIKDTEPFVIILLATVFPMPRLREIKLHTIVSIRNG